MTTLSASDLDQVCGGLDLGPAGRMLQRGAEDGAAGTVLGAGTGALVGGTVGLFGGPATGLAGVAIGGATGAATGALVGFGTGVIRQGVAEFRNRK